MAAPSQEDILRDMFEIVDEDKKGTITLRQLLETVDLMRPSHRGYEGEGLQVPKANEDDKLNFDEFQSNVLHLVDRMGITLAEGLLKLRGELLPEERVLLTQLFQVVDIDGGGSITKDELREMMNVLHPGKNDQDILRIMLSADTDGGGDIDFEEFCKYIHDARLEMDTIDAVRTLATAFEKQREKLEQTKRAFEEQEQVGPAAKLTPAEAARLKRERRKKGLADESSLEKLLAEEAKSRKALEDEEDEAWASLSSGAGAALGDLSTAERIEREKDRERRRRAYLSGGREAQMNEITKMREKRHKEELEHNKEKSSEQRFQLEDRMAAQQSQMLAFGQQFKVLRQYLNKGTEFVRLEADREFSDMQKTIPKRKEEMTGALNRVDSMLVTVGRALMQESMLLHGDGHKEVLRNFRGDPDFTWLSTGGGGQPSRQRSQNTRVTATHVNFGDTCNLDRDVEAVPMQVKMKELKKHLWATYRFYQSTEEGITFLDWQKLVSNVKVDVAGSVSVLWANALKMKENAEVLGLQGLNDVFLESGAAFDNDEVTVPDRIDFHQFANLLLILACERYITSPSATPQYKLQCFLLNEVLPLLPLDSLTHITSDTIVSPLQLLNTTKLQTIPLLLEEHLDILEPVAGVIQKDIQRYLGGRQFSRRALETEKHGVDGSVLCAANFLSSMDVMVTRYEAGLPRVPVSKGAREAVRRLQGDKGQPVLPVKEVTNYLVHRASLVGRGTLKEVVVRGLRELLTATYPTVGLPNLNPDTSPEAVPFPVFLALCARIASYTSVAAATPTAPSQKPQKSQVAQPVFNFMQLITHPGHYVLTL